MAFTNWDTTFEGIPATTTNPEDHPGEVQDFKEGVRTIIEMEHEGDVDAGTDLTGEHKAGSAKAYYDTEANIDAETRPDGSTALDTDDAGRIAVVSDKDDAIRIWDGSAWKYEFEDDDVDQTVAPTGTLTSLQDKIDALAHQVNDIIGRASWTFAAARSIANIDAVLTELEDGGYSYSNSAYTSAQMFAALSPWAALGERRPITGAIVTTVGGLTLIPSFIYRTSATEISIYGIRDSGSLTLVVNSASSSAFSDAHSLSLTGIPW